MIGKSNRGKAAFSEAEGLAFGIKAFSKDIQPSPAQSSSAQPSCGAADEEEEKKREKGEAASKHTFQVFMEARGKQAEALLSYPLLSCPAPLSFLLVFLVSRHAAEEEKEVGGPGLAPADRRPGT